MVDRLLSPTVPGPGRASILLVEDNPLDARSTLRAARKLDLVEAVEVVTDGQTALAHLRRGWPGPGAYGLVLLDLNLPGKDGHDVLVEIRSDPALRTLPVVILSSSTDATDIDAAYREGANAYLSKPSGLDDWLRVMDAVREFWLGVALLPGRG